MIMNLEDRLYTSTEVAEILGVSLRSVYRYLDEEKLKAEVKTATGRHRFTRQNIIEFLYPQVEKTKEAQAPVKEEVKETIQPVQQREVVIEETQVIPELEEKVTKTETEEPIDWLAKFRAAANKYREEDETFRQEPTVQETKTEETQVSEPEKETVESMGTMTDIYGTDESKEKEPGKQYFYYRSLIGGLKDIAQNVDKSAKNASVDYAFTMNAGLSLHKPIRPFSLLHVYVRPEDREFFERMLNLVTADEKTSQLCLISTRDNSIFANKREMHGLSVVSDMLLKQDLQEHGEEQLARELEETLTA